MQQKLAKNVFYNYVSTAPKLSPIKTKQVRKRKLDKVLLDQHFRQFPDAILRERAEHFKVSHNAIWKSLRQRNIVKKTTKYAERNHSKRMWFLNELRAYVKMDTSKNIIYFDESGFAANVYRMHGWAVRGQKIYGDITGNHHRRRTNLIMAQRGKSWPAPMLFNVGCNQDVVLTWIKDCLLPELGEPSLTSW